MQPLNRRGFLQQAAAASFVGLADAQQPGDRPRPPAGISVLNPAGRVPVSLIIDDSTCLVNLAHFDIPQLAEVFPDRYQQDWKKLPREIPDAFVRKFAAWCRDHGVKGKYSVIPYPACVGWLDRDLPGWSKKELDVSLRLLRDDLSPDWDFHPEMATHTWVIDTRTGRPYPEKTERFMENFGWSEGKSTDELADYMSYALRILRNAGVRCEGITTPGGFGNRALPELAQATRQACRDVFRAEIPHYFRHVFTNQRSVAPRVEYASGLETSDPRCVVSIIGCTGDWFGGWDGITPGSADRHITADLKGGRLPDVIRRGEPAIIVCHWPGLYFNGEEVGFRIFQQVVERLRAGFDHLIWMKLSEIARYWAARELTRIERQANSVAFQAPFGAGRFTVQISTRGRIPRLVIEERPVPLGEVQEVLQLRSGCWFRGRETVTVCFDLPKGASRLDLS